MFLLHLPVYMKVNRLYCLKQSIVKYDFNYKLTPQNIPYKDKYTCKKLHFCLVLFQQSVL